MGELYFKKNYHTVKICIKSMIKSCLVKNDKSLDNTQFNRNWNLYLPVLQQHTLSLDFPLVTHRASPFIPHTLVHLENLGCLNLMHSSNWVPYLLLLPLTRKGFSIFSIALQHKLLLKSSHKFISSRKFL